MLRPRTPLLSLLLLGLVLSPWGCTSSESPTEPDSRSVLHLVGQNGSSTTIGLHQWVEGGPLYPVEVPPGSSVEFRRWRNVRRVTGDSFYVFLPTPAGPAPFSDWAQVQYNIDVPVSVQARDLTVNVRVSIDPTGSLSVTSDHPEIFQVVQITNPAPK